MCLCCWGLGDIRLIVEAEIVREQERYTRELQTQEEKDC